MGIDKLQRIFPHRCFFFTKLTTNSSRLPPSATGSGKLSFDSLQAHFNRDASVKIGGPFFGAGAESNPHSQLGKNEFQCSLESILYSKQSSYLFILEMW